MHIQRKAPYSQYSTDKGEEQDGIFHLKPFKFRGSTGGHKAAEPPTTVRFSRASCLSTKESGDQWKITSPALMRAHALARIHTRQIQSGPVKRLTLRQLEVLIGKGTGGGGHGSVVRAKWPAASCATDDIQ